MSEKLAIAAEELAKDQKIMESYKGLKNGTGFYLTKNPKIKDSVTYPSKFPDSSKNFAQKWKDGVGFLKAQKIYLLYLAGFSSSYAIKESDYEKIKVSYAKWKSIEYRAYRIVVLGIEANACNLFVGEALYMIKESILNSDDKYPSAKEIYQKFGGLIIVEKKDLCRGDIFATGTHVEIVTQVMHDRWLRNDGFCSRGAGRSEGEDAGKERCDGIFSSTRDIYREKNRFLRI